MLEEHIKQELKKAGLRANKTLGQHFLISEEMRDAVVEVSGVKSDGTVLEVGPGIGFLTEELLRKVKHVYAIELSDDLYGFLSKKYNNNAKLTLIHEDILKLHIDTLFRDQKKEPIVHDLNRSIGSYHVVSNIPYYLTGKLIPYFLENTLKPRSLTLMVQKEVAMRLTEVEGKSSIPSIAAQFFAEVSYCFDVSREHFFPVPAVDSAVIHMEIKSAVPDVDQKLFFSILRGVFAGKRKQLRNSVAALFHMEKEAARAWLESIGINPGTRPERLTLDDFVTLTYNAATMNVR
ncbi:ribosomal RNA small subunit methyltransferase A [Patescibacteria group bacterium]|nr:ribosomal RNA small subunit methyltransferase A [Patescibacteria group bacterium]